ncbi:MAG: helix-turn-helix domain-containing protein [Velocimicrobium sp.]
MLSKKIRILAARGNKKAIGMVLDTYEEILKNKATKEGEMDQDLYEELVLNLIIHLPQVDI